MTCPPRIDLADAWSRCNARVGTACDLAYFDSSRWAGPVWCAVTFVPAAGLAYVENRKSGSTTIKKALERRWPLCFDSSEMMAKCSAECGCDVPNLADQCGVPNEDCRRKDNASATLEPPRDQNIREARCAESKCVKACQDRVMLRDYFLFSFVRSDVVGRFFSGLEQVRHAVSLISSLALLTFLTLSRRRSTTASAGRTGR